MKVLVVCLLVAALGDAAPSDVTGDVPTVTSLAGTSASSASSSVVSVEKTSADSSAATHGEKTEPAAGDVAAVSSIDLHKTKAEGQDKGDAPVEPVVEAADPSASAGYDLSSIPPVKKVPVFVPVEYAGAYHPDNFFNPYPVTSGLGEYVTAPAAAYPYRTVVHPWYQLVSPQVPIVTLYPGDSEEIYRGSGMACADPTLKYIPGTAPMIYTGPSAASPYAANHYAAASLAAGGNPNPYGSRVPYYKFSYVPDASLFGTPSVDYSRSTLSVPPSKLSSISSISPLSRLSSPHSHVYIYPDSPKFNPYIQHSSPLASMKFYTTNGRLINV